MFIQDEEISVTIITSTLLMVFFIAIIIFAVIRYQIRSKKYQQEINALKLTFHQEVIKAQFEKEEQTLHRISQEIHDNIGQILSFIKINLNTIELAGCDTPAKDKIVLTKEMVNNAINELRQLTKTLNNSYLKKQFLSESLQIEMNIINKVGLLKTNFEVKGDERIFDPEKQLIIFRIVQEALNNILKHSNACTISISLNYRKENLYLNISDDGKGIANYRKESTDRLTGDGTGLENILHRAKVIESKVEIETEKNKGTNIKLTIPY